MVNLSPYQIKSGDLQDLWLREDGRRIVLYNCYLLILLRRIYWTGLQLFHYFFLYSSQQFWSLERKSKIKSSGIEEWVVSALETPTPDFLSPSLPPFITHCSCFFSCYFIFLSSFRVLCEGLNSIPFSDDDNTSVSCMHCLTKKKILACCNSERRWCPFWCFTHLWPSPIPRSEA